MTNKIETFQSLAANVLVKGTSLKAENKDQKANQNRLSFLVLNILLTGNNAEYKAIASSFAKDGGQFFSLRMVLTRAKAVAKALNQGPLSYSKGKETITATMDQVKAWDVNSLEIPFNVSSAYNALKASIEAIEEKPATREEQALSLYIQAQGLTEKEFNERIEIGAENKDQAIAQGLVILDDMEKAEAQAKAPNLAETIREQFLQLASMEKAMAFDLLESLVKNHYDKNNGKKSKTLDAVAA